MVKPTGVISGTATGPDGTPVAGATVSLVDVNNNTVASVTTGTDGTYTLPAVTLGNYTVDAIKALPDGTHLQADVQVTLSSATQTVDLPMANIIDNVERNN